VALTAPEIIDQPRTSRFQQADGQQMVRSYVRDPWRIRSMIDGFRQCTPSSVPAAWMCFDFNTCRRGAQINDLGLAFRHHIPIFILLQDKLHTNQSGGKRQARQGDIIITCDVSVSTAQIPQHKK